MPAARIQPQGRVRLNSSVTRGAAALIVSGRAGTRFTPQSPSLAAFQTGPFGTGFRSTGAASGLSWTTAENTPVSGAMPRTMFARFTLNSTAANSSILALGTGLSSSLFSLSCYNGSLILHIQGSFSTALASPVAGVVYDFAATYDGATLVTYINGAQTSSAAYNLTTTSSPLFVGGSNDYFATSCDSVIWIGGIVARCFSPTEVAALARNPFSVFDGPAPMLYAASAPASVSGSITWTEASDSVAAAGSATVSGTAAWTEASDSAALAGSVGSAVSIAASWTEAADTIAIAGAAQVNATGAWTEAADSAAIAASASITAAAAWTEQADTISMAGSAGNGIAANITWTEAADVITVAGSISITAAGNWTEAGDSAAIVVNVAAAQSASLSWTEAPDSIAIAASVTAAPVVGTIAWTEQADIAAKPTYPGFYSFTLMRSDPISSAGAMSSSAPAFTLMRADSIASSSKMSAAPINQNVNLI